MSVNIYNKETGELIQIAGNANGIIDDANVSNKTAYSSEKIEELTKIKLKEITQNITEANNNISNLSSTKAEKTDLDNTNIIIGNSVCPNSCICKFCISCSASFCKLCEIIYSCTFCCNFLFSIYYFFI